MYKFAICLLLLIVSSSSARTLDEMVQSALSNNQDLKSLETSIKIANEQINIAGNWQNPVVSLGRNDIRMDDPNKRDLEPMQADYIGFSQVIPMTDKLEIKHVIAKQQSSIAKLNLEDAQLQLKAKVYEYAYSIKVLERKYELLTKYQNNIERLEELLTALYENGKMQQSQLIEVKIRFSKLQLQKENLKNLINNLYLKLEQVTYLDIQTVDLSLHLEPIGFKLDIEEHPKVKMTQLLSKQFQEQSRYELANKNSDIKFNVAYFSRDSKYEDYANVSVNIPLSIYGTENSKAVQAKLKSQEVENKLLDLKQGFTIQLQMLQNSLNSAYTTYGIIQDTILPLKEQLQMSIESYNSLNQVSPTKSIQNLNELINYEMMLLDEMNKYFQSYAQAIYFTQGNVHGSIKGKAQ